MARYAFVKDAKVTNVVLADAGFVANHTPTGHTAHQLPDNSPVCPGWGYAAGNFTEPVPDPEYLRQLELGAAIREDSRIAAFKAKTKMQQEQWMTDNVTTLAQAREFLLQLARYTLYRD